MTPTQTADCNRDARASFAAPIGSGNMTMEREIVCHSASMHSRKSILDVIRPKDYSDEFYTPDPIVDALGEFDLDPCALARSHTPSVT